MADLKTTNIYGDAYINNKVGIATNAPATRLQIGQLLPTAATEGIQFGDDTSARIYRDSSTLIKVSGGFTSTTFINAGNYLQTSGNLIYPASQTATQRLEVGNASGNAWIDGLTIAQGGNVTVYNNLTSPSITVSGYITFPNDTNAAGLINTAGTAWLKLDDAYGNMYIVNNQSGAGIYFDSNAYYWRNSNGATTLLSLSGNGDLGAARYLSGTYVNTSDDVSTGNITHIVAKFGDNYHRSATAAKVAAFISGQTMNIVGTSTNITAYTINQNVGTANSPTFVGLTVAGGNATIYRDLIVNGGASNPYGNRIIVQGTATTYTLQDSTLRPTVYLNGDYPVLTLNATATGNTNHGGTIQFACNGLSTGGSTGRQIVIGANGVGSWLDFGFSGGGNGDNSNYNPHNGISGYSGVTAMRLFSNGLLVGSTGAYPNHITSISYALDVRGTGYFSSTLTVGGNISAANLSGTNTGDQSIGNGTITIAAGTGIGVGTSNTFTTNQSGATTVTVTNSGVTSLAGTTNRVTVSGATGAVTLNLPQDIHTGASPTFSGLSLTSVSTTGATITNLTGAYQNTTVYDSPRTQSATPSRGIRAPASSIQFTDSYAIAPFYTYRSTGDWPVPYGIGWGTGGESSGIFQRYASNGYSFGDMIFYTGNDGSGAFSFRRHTWEGTTYFAAGSGELNTELFRIDWSGNVSMLGTLNGSANSATLYANPSSYGSWKIGGTRNGWYGIEFESGTNLMANSNEVGFHRNGSGWQMRWSAGVGYVYKGNPGGGTEAVILDSSNSPYANNMNQYVRTTDSPTFSELTLSGQGMGAYNLMKYSGIRSGNWQTFTTTEGQLNVIQVNDIAGGAHTNYPTGVYTYGAVMSWRTNSHSFQLYAAHTGDLAYKTQWGNDNYSGWRRILDSTNYIHAANMNQYVRTTDTCSFAGLTVSNTINGSVTGNAGGSSTSCTGNAATATNVNISNLATQQVSISLAAGSWYTIAANDANRASAKFTITDTSSGLHQAIHFYATAHYGTDSGAKISVISNTYYGGPPVSAIKIMRGSTYDGAMVQIYAMSACALTVSIYDNQQSSGWVIKSGVVSTTNPGTVAAFASLTTMAAQVDLSAAKSFSVSDEIYIGGATTQYKALHTNNYNSYAPTLTGTGASGTWSINVTGNAGGSSTSCTGNAATVTNGMYLSGTQTISGVKYFTSNLGTTLGSLSDPPLQAFASGTNSAFMSFHRGGSFAVNFGLDSDNVLRIGGWSAAANRLQLDMSGNLTLAGVVDATQFRDSSDTTYFVDPAGTSNLNQWSTSTAARLGRSRYWTNRLAYTSDTNYHTGTNGWSTDEGTWASAWKGGFSGWDMWGSNMDHPQGSGYVHAQGIVSGQHLTTTNGSSAYGWMMVGAHAATDNRYWLRGKWSTSTSGWVEMLTSGNYNSFSPTLTGTGASGTWAINVTGTAGSISGFNNPAVAATANTIVYRSGGGDITGAYILGSYFNASAGNSENPTIGQIWTQNTTDNYLRKSTPAHFRSQVTDGSYPSLTGANASGTWSINITGNAGTATTAVSATSATSATFLNSSNYIQRIGSSGNYNTDFQNTPAGSVRHIGDDYAMTNNPGAGWWFVDSYRHSNGNGYWGTQVAWGWEDNANRLATRNVQNGSYGGWVYYLNSANYNSYSPTLTGTGASGTWAINITGNAATATTATNVTIANGSVTLAKIENITAYTILGNSNASAAATPAALSVATVATMLSGQTMNINGSSTSCSGNAATATALTSMNISQFTNNSGYLTSVTNISGNAATATLATKASTLSQGGGTGTGMTFNWSGQGGQPTWLWGSNDGTNIYVWNPSNFNVNYATSAGSATNVAASGITGQTGMWTSAARPGPYRLYRRDSNDAYSVQNYWTGTYWRLDGYYSNDTLHAGCSVSYADTAGALNTSNNYRVTNFGIDISPANKLHINGDNVNPTIRVDNGAIDTTTTSGNRSFFGWLPISIGGNTRWIRLFN